MGRYRIVKADDERYINAPIERVRRFSEWTEEEKKEWEKGEHIIIRGFSEEGNIEKREMVPITEIFKRDEELYKKLVELNEKYDDSSEDDYDLDDETLSLINEEIKGWK